MYSPDMHYAEKKHMAQYIKTSVEDLRKLAKDGDDWVRQHVAKNPSTPAAVLVMLFEDEKNAKNTASFIIHALYCNKNLPAFAKRVIETLYRDWVPWNLKP